MKIRQRKTDRQAAAEPVPWWKKEVAQIKSFHAESNADALHDLAIELLNRCKSDEEQVEQLRQIHDALKAECEAVTAHEHYQAVITAVSDNGSRSVEVAGLGNGRTSIAVHPDVDSEQLRVGANAWVNRGRNCLLEVSQQATPWSDVATFEQYLKGRRVLVKHREEWIALELADPLQDLQLSKGDLLGCDREGSCLAFERLDPPNQDHLFDDTIEADFGDLVGLEQPIALIRNVIDFRLRYPELATVYGLPEQHGLLLWGPAGNGKTHIARCVASYLRQLFPGLPCRFMHISGSQDYSMWFGRSEQTIIERFAAAREASREGTVVMFFDEIDAIGRRRGSDYGSGAPDRILNTFLTQLDGIVQHSNIVVLAATNRPDTLDEGLTRPGRFDSKVEIPAPSRRTAMAIVEHYLRTRPLADGSDKLEQLVAPLLATLFAPNGHYAQVAQVKLRDGRRVPVPGRELLSGAALKNLVAVAARQAALRETQTGVRGIREDDLAAALDRELHNVVSLLTPLNVQTYVKSVPRDAQPIDVELPPRRTTTYLRSHD